EQRHPQTKLFPYTTLFRSLLREQIKKLRRINNERAARNYRDRVADREVDADERKTKQVRLSRQPAREQDANQGRGSAFVSKESDRRKHVQLLRQSKACSWTARTDS